MERACIKTYLGQGPIYLSQKSSKQKLYAIASVVRAAVRDQRLPLEIISDPQSLFLCKVSDIPRSKPLYVLASITLLPIEN